MEDEIAKQVASLAKIVRDALFSCKISSVIVRGPSGQIWHNYTYEYTEIDKEVLRKRMLEACKEMKFQPPRSSNES